MLSSSLRPALGRTVSYRLGLLNNQISYFMRRAVRLFRPLAARRYQSSGGAGAFFQDDAPARTEQQKQEEQDYKSNEDLQSHPFVREKLFPRPQKIPSEILSPLKNALYQKVVQDHGEYRNKQLVSHEGKTYRLSLSREEQRALEPSVYVSSYRIKSSWKKTYMFLRMFRRMALDDAITQCQFSAKRMARDVGEALERGRKDAIALGLQPERMVVEQIWVGKDGDDRKRMQSKGRGRTGVITHPYVHVKAILKDVSVFEQRQKWMKDRLDRKLWFQLRNWKIKEDFVQTADYKW